MGFIRRQTGCRPGSSSRAISHWRGHESKSVHRVECPSSGSLVLKVWMIPGELLVISLCEKVEELDFSIGEGCCNNRWVNLPTTVKVSRLKAVSFFHSLWSLLVPEVQPIFRVGLLASNKMVKKVTQGKAQKLVFSFILGTVKLTIKISNYNAPPGSMIMPSRGEDEYTVKHGDGHSRCLNVAFGEKPPCVNSPAFTFTE